MTRGVLPLPGPLEDPPDVTEQTAHVMREQALRGLLLGAWDRQWLAGLDPQASATLASLLRRAFDAGLTAGRGEKLDERPTVRALRARLAEAATVTARTKRDLADMRAMRDWYSGALDQIAAVVAEARSQDQSEVGQLLSTIEIMIGGGR